jgi:hypothetical protein
MKLIIKGINAFMHIIGKILEGSLRCIFIIKINVVTGAQKIT